MSDTPRITIVLPDFSRYQAQGATSIDLYARDSVRFSRLAGAITIIGPASDSPFDDGAPVVGLPAPGRHVPRRLLLKAIRDSRPDLVEVHQDVNLAGWLARRLTSPVLVYRHNSQKLPKGALRRWRKRWEWGGIAGFAFVSAYLRDAFVAAFPAWAGRAHVAYNGIDPAAWAAPPTPRAPLIAFVGRLVPQKGVLPLAEAMRTVLARHGDWRLRVLRGDPAEETAECRGAIEGLTRDFPGRVELKGPLPYAEVPAELAAAAIAVVPSLWPEPFGRTAIEAMAAGCALVASARGGLAEIVSDETGIVTEPPEPARLIAAIERLIGDEGLRLRLASAGQHLAGERFAARACVAAVDRLRETLVRQSR